MTQHLYKYNVWNTIGRSTIRSANATAGAALMFCLIGKVVDLVFEEEIQTMGSLIRNTFVGMWTEALYKSTLG